MVERLKMVVHHKMMLPSEIAKLVSEGNKVILLSPLGRSVIQADGIFPSYDRYGQFPVVQTSHDEFQVHFFPES